MDIDRLDRLAEVAAEFGSISRDGLRVLFNVVRAEALEEAAKACDRRFMGDLNREDMEARRCAAAIRALKSTGPSNP